MKTFPSKSPAGSFSLEPCQICNELKKKFYLCCQNHSTCDDCKVVPEPRALRRHTAGDSSLSVKKRVSLSPHESARTSPQPPSCSTSRFSPLSALSPNRNTVNGLGSNASTGPPSRRSRSPSNDPPSIFSSRSPIKSLVTIPRASGTNSEQIDVKPVQLNFNDEDIVQKSREPSKRNSQAPPIIVEEDCSDTLKILCVACDAFVEVTAITLPINMLKSFVQQRKDHVDAEVDHDDSEEEYEKHYDEHYDGAVSGVPATSFELYDDEGLRRDVDKLRIELATAYSELVTTRGDLDEVMYVTEKLEMDVDMLKGGVNYVYFNFDTILKRGEVRTEERICGIPFVLMVRLRKVARVHHLGFFVGLEPCEGRAHSPLKKIIVFRAHNAYGKIIERHALETFENGRIAHPCFDMSKRQDGSMFGYANFLKKDRILKPDMLKDGRLCLSLQMKPLM